MKTLVISPIIITFLTLFFACSHSSNLNKSKSQFNKVTGKSDDSQSSELLNFNCPSEYDSNWQKKLVIHHFNIGQGDSTLITTPDGTTILVDTGEPKAAEENLIPRLKDCYNIKNLDYAILTHFHHDHSGGFEKFIDDYPVSINKAVYDPGDKVIERDRRNIPSITKYKTWANSTGKRKVPSLGANTINSNSKVKFSVVAVNGELLGGIKVNIFKSNGDLKDTNSVSIAIKIKYGDFDYLVGGDLTGGGNGKPDVESFLAPIVGDIDVLRSNHHGSNTSNNDFFLDTLRPENVVISVGDGNTHHLPNKLVIERMFNKNYIENIFQTQEGNGSADESVKGKSRVANGDIILISEMDKFTINGQLFNTDGI